MDTLLYSAGGVSTLLYAAFFLSALFTLGHTPGQRAKTLATQLSNHRRLWRQWGWMPMGLHAAVLIGLLHNPEQNIGLAYSASAVVWLSMAMVWVIGRFISMLLPRTILTLLATTLVLTPWFFTGNTPISTLANPWLATHFIVAMLASGIMLLAALQALWLIGLNRYLQHQHAQKFQGAPAWRALFETAPPLLVLEYALFITLGIGFALLTLVLISGIVFSNIDLAHFWLQANEKTFLGLASWLILAVVLVGRWFCGWRGRYTLHWTLAGCSCLMLSYLGSLFVLQTLII